MDFKMEIPSTRHACIGLIVGDDMISVDQLTPHFRLEKGAPPNSHDEHGFGDQLFSAYSGDHFKDLLNLRDRMDDYCHEDKGDGEDGH